MRLELRGRTNEGDSMGSASVGMLQELESAEGALALRPEASCSVFFRGIKFVHILRVLPATRFWCLRVAGDVRSLL
jgi:hypothetical protein